MRFIHNLKANRIKAYFHCYNCFSRSPRVWKHFSGEPIPVYLTSDSDKERASKLIEEIREKAYNAAMGLVPPGDDSEYTDDDIPDDVCSEEFNKLFEIDEI